MMITVKDSVTDADTDTDIDEFTRTYARPNGWRGTEGLYQSIFTDTGRTKALAETQPLAVPVLTIAAFSTPGTEQTFRQVTAGDVTSVQFDEVGRFVAQEAPKALATPCCSSLGGWTATTSKA